MVAEVDEWPALRAAGAAIKDDALRRLDELLRAARGRGCGDAGGDGALGAGRRGRRRGSSPTWCGRPAPTRCSRSSRWLTQEIGLNEALLDAGISAVETDLAELIVQLGRRHAPSHILVPAIHYNRAEIRDIFAATDLPGADAGR